MNFTMHRESSQSTLTTVALLTAAIGFGGGWLLHRHLDGRMLQSHRGPVKPVATAVAAPVNDLAAFEAECPGASRVIVKDVHRYSIDRAALKCLMSSADPRLATLRAAPRYEPSAFRDKPNGFRVFDIKPGSLAARIGLQNGDVIRTVDSKLVNTEEDLVNAYRRLGSGNYASIVLQRKGQLTSFVYYLGATRR